MISPARSKSEETISILGSALLVKNKPETNQCMNHNSLLKEYVDEVTLL